MGIVMSIKGNGYIVIGWYPFSISTGVSVFVLQPDLLQQLCLILRGCVWHFENNGLTTAGRLHTNTHV